MIDTSPRLFVLFRPESERAVVLRQGPSKVFCALGWELKTDSIEIGQWCRHKIYVDRCDISANGKYLVYFALNGRWEGEAKGAWTALSFAPYLKALKLWPQGDTWGGGRMFYSDRARAPAHIEGMWDQLEQVEGERLGSGQRAGRS